MTPTLEDVGKALHSYEHALLNEVSYERTRAPLPEHKNALRKITHATQQNYARVLKEYCECPNTPTAQPAP
jgi:hypothetical protein